MRKRFRSGLLAVVMPVILSVFSGCTEQVRPELDKTHAKLQALQERADSVNWDLHVLNLIVEELNDDHTILPETYRLTDEGYEVSFRDGKTIVIPFGRPSASSSRTASSTPLAKHPMQVVSPPPAWR